MQVIASWTGSHADALRQSLRMTNESFAEYLDVAVRTVANWRKRPEMIPTPANQQLLDAGLTRAPDQAKAHFAMLVNQSENGKRTEAPGRLRDTGRGPAQGVPRCQHRVRGLWVP